MTELRIWKTVRALARVTMSKKEDFLSLVLSAVEKETLTKLVFSRPVEGEIAKVTARLVAHRRKRLLALEYSLPGNTVSHKNLHKEEMSCELSGLLSAYRQANLITTLGSAEYKVSKSGAEVVLGGDALKRKLCGNASGFESALQSLDKKKNYILTGEEPFLKKLGISSSDGRIHDKRQGKFRQINRFLEHIEDIYHRLPETGEIRIFDLCCGKSYLSFAVYYYLTEVKGRRVYMLGADLKRDVISWCEGVARELGYSGMRFVVEDISKMVYDTPPNMVISLHACDVATDIVLDTAVRLGASVILSTPCCHRYINGKITAGELGFITRFPHIAGKLGEAVTDALRAMRLKARGYSVSVLELTDPENTPKNTLIRATKNEKMSQAARDNAEAEYKAALRFILGEGADSYLEDILK